MKKLTVVGRGTVGSLSVIHFLKYTNFEIDWVFDSNIPTTSVGEGTSLIFPRELLSSMDWHHDDLIKMRGTVKQGIYKENWSVGKSFLHAFPIDSVGIHLSAVNFQNEIFNTLKENPRINFIEKNIENLDECDSDFIISCKGSQKNLEEFDVQEYIPVNSAYVTHCFWDYPKFAYTLTIAMPWGWIFGIPLLDRCAIGYVYNDKFATLSTIKEDVKEIFEKYNLTPSEKTNHIKFNNYSRKKNFDGRIVYNGNDSFFLEPLEATSTGISAHINRKSYDRFFNLFSEKDVNMWYKQELNDIESMICLHYMAGSIFENEFWSYAKDLARKKIEKEFINKSELSYFLIHSLKSDILNNPSPVQIGQWVDRSYKVNIKNMGLEEEILSLGKKYLI